MKNTRKKAAATKPKVRSKSTAKKIRVRDLEGHPEAVKAGGLLCGVRR